MMLESLILEHQVNFGEAFYCVTIAHYSSKFLRTIWKYVMPEILFEKP